MTRTATFLVASLALFSALPNAADAAAKKYRNCAALNADYPTGVGRSGAVDKVKNNSQPVIDFTVDDALYRSLPKTLDRDKDGIACEKLA